MKQGRKEDDLKVFQKDHYRLKAVHCVMNWYHVLCSKLVCIWVRGVSFNVFTKTGDAQGDKFQGNLCGGFFDIILCSNVFEWFRVGTERSQTKTTHLPTSQNLSKLFLFQNHPT